MQILPSTVSFFGCRLVTARQSKLRNPIISKWHRFDINRHTVIDVSHFVAFMFPSFLLLLPTCWIRFAFMLVVASSRASAMIGVMVAFAIISTKQNVEWYSLIEVV